MSGDAGIRERLARVRERLERAAARAGRDPAQVTLLGAAKGQPAERVIAAVEAGLTHVGENFAQEARDKIPEVAGRLAARGFAPPRWHFVGSLQRNKARLVAPLFDCVESLDRISLARELDRRALAAGRRIEVLLQVNLDAEAQKAGVPPEQAARLLEEVATLSSLRVMGLMTIPAVTADPEAARPAFARLRELRDALCKEPGGHTLRELSMGMSADFEVAVEEGATLVRIGTALFGPRARS